MIFLDKRKKTLMESKVKVDFDRNRKLVDHIYRGRKKFALFDYKLDSKVIWMNHIITINFFRYITRTFYLGIYLPT